MPKHCLMWLRPSTECRVASSLEKLRLWDSGLDDAVVELWKTELEAAEPRLSEACLRFEERAADEVIFSVGEAGERIAAPWARYVLLHRLRLHLRQQHPALFKGPWVHRRRVDDASKTL